MKRLLQHYPEHSNFGNDCYLLDLADYHLGSVA